MDLAKIKEVLRNGPYAWPGGYPLFFMTIDGEPLSFEAVRKNYREVVRSHIANDYRSGFYIQAYGVNWEDDTLICAETGKPIDYAYPPD